MFNPISRKLHANTLARKSLVLFTAMLTQNSLLDERWSPILPSKPPRANSNLPSLLKSLFRSASQRPSSHWTRWPGKSWKVCWKKPWSVLSRKRRLLSRVDRNLGLGIFNRLSENLTELRKADHFFILWFSAFYDNKKRRTPLLRLSGASTFLKLIKLDCFVLKILYIYM